MVARWPDSRQNSRALGLTDHFGLTTQLVSDPDSNRSRNRERVDADPEDYRGYRRQYELATRLAGKPMLYTELGPRFLAEQAKVNPGMVLLHRRPWLHPWNGNQTFEFAKPCSGPLALCYAAHVGKGAIRKFGSQSRKEILRSKIACTTLSAMET